MNLSRLVACLRLYRLAVKRRAMEANLDGQPDAAAAWWRVGQDVTAFIKHLTRKEP